MAVINNFANRKYIETQAILSYSFTNELQSKIVGLTEITIKSINLFYKGLKFDLLNNCQFVYATKRINININPRNFLPIKKCCFHIEINYSYNNKDFNFGETVKFFPYVITPSIKRNKCVSVDKKKVKKVEVNTNDAELILTYFLQQASKSPNNVWHNKTFNPNNELMVIIKSNGVYINKKVLDKKFGTNKLAYIRRLVEDNVFEIFNNGKYANMVNVSNIEQSCLRTNCYKLTDVFIKELNELGIKF